MTLPNKLPSQRLFVGSLPYRYTEGQLLELFVPFGRIISLKIMHTPWGKSRGIGFVEFDNLESAIEAKSKLHNFFIEDRSIIVDFAQADPAVTPEGRERHLQAVQRNPHKFKQLNSVSPVNQVSGRDRKFKSFSSRPKHSSISPSKFDHQRQSVYDSRTHHASVGKKFARRFKKKLS